MIDSLPDYLTGKLEERYSILRLHEADEPKSYLNRVGPDVRAVVTRAVVGVDASVFDACPNLELIVTRGVGVERLNVPLARSRGIAVANTPDVHSEDVASLAVALLLVAGRNLVSNHRFVTDGKWTSIQARPAPGTDLRGTRVGIAGLGRIGQLVAARLLPFGCKIAYTGRRAQPEKPFAYYGSVLELAKDCDALIACLPGGTETANLIDAAVFAALGPQGIFVNVGRGSTVDEPALIEALQQKRLRAAALDVYANEPAVPSALLTMDNVVLQPHQGAATVQAQRAIDDLVLANLDAHFAGAPLPSPVP